MSRGLTVAVVGLGFGSEFVPIYLDHPDVSDVVLCEPDHTLRARVSTALGIERTVASLDDLLDDDGIDAVHLATPIPLHGRQSIQSLRAGKHVACAVPAAVDIDELHAIVELQKSSGKNFMMMETAVYTREFLHVAELVQAGEFGKLIFGRGVHHQDMRGWPSYWIGMPPMYYATHAIAPLLALFDTRAASVRCLGAGTLPDHEQTRWSNPYPVETAIFQLDGTDGVVEVTRSLFQLMRSPVEAFSIYGSSQGFEWGQLDERDDPAFFTPSPDTRHAYSERRRIPDHLDTLPGSLRPHATAHTTPLPGQGYLTSGGGHGGSHPHLVNEFISSIVDERPAAIDAIRAADWTAAGIMAHHSAATGGATVTIPKFRE